jgi:hypothetical protein
MKMTATRNDIQEWLAEAQEKGSAFLIIGYDWFDRSNFPVFCDSAEACRNKLASLKSSGNRYDEVYDLSLSVEDQLAERRALHYPSDE